MKKKIVLIISLLAVLMVSACGNSGTASISPSQTLAGAGENSSLSTLSKLVAGTYRLIDSGSSITGEQAGELAILWKAYNELQTRDTTAAQETTDLLDQINSSLTLDQQAAIESMNLSGQDVMSMVQEIGVSTNQRRNSSSQNSSSNSDSIPGGGMPPDMMMGAGGGMEAGFVPGANAIATPSADDLAEMQAKRADTGAQLETMVLILIDPLITKLESVTNSN